MLAPRLLSALLFFVLLSGILLCPAILPAKAEDSPADYVNSLGGKVDYWHAVKMPLRILLKVDPKIPNYKSQFKDYFLAACKSWSSASQEKVTFKFVDAEPYDIYVSWTNEVSQLMQKGELGEARWETCPDGLYAATIKLLTVSADGQKPISDQEAKLMCLHELGHALGLVKHSPFLGDIMNACIDYNYNTPVEKLELSQRDKNTILRLYTECDALVERLSAQSDDPRDKLMRLYYRASNLLQQEKYDPAYILLEQALEIDPKCVHALSAMAQCCFEQGMDYYSNGDHARAIARLERFISVAGALKMDSPQISQAKESINRCKAKMNQAPVK